jgi:hypothetical protein
MSSSSAPLNPFHAVQYPLRPAQFIRITDTKSFVKYGYAGHDPDPAAGFDVGYSTRYIALSHRLTPASVKAHLEWSPCVDWKGLISLCGTEQKARREKEWRAQKCREDVKAYHISTQALRWTTFQWSDTITLDVLVDDSEDVMIFAATQLIQKLGLSGSLKWEAREGARDEWLALEWIPRSMVIGVEG